MRNMSKKVTKEVKEDHDDGVFFGCGGPASAETSQEFTESQSTDLFDREDYKEFQKKRKTKNA